VGIDLLQVREPDLTTRELTALLSEVVEAVGERTLVLVNDRFDVALAAGAGGVHLKSSSLDTQTVRECVGSSIAIGVSTHSEIDVRRAEANGADFVVCGPVFDTPSKRHFGKPLGIEYFATSVASSDIPVFGLGGVDASRSSAILSAGAVGIAGIRVFQDAWLEGGIEGLSEIAIALRTR
jgi:thiamine-phosphate pyrophosphorylase